MSVIILRVFTAGALVLTVAACGREPAPVPSMGDVRAETAPSQESWNVRYQVTETPEGADDSRPRLDIEAMYMATFETEDSTYTVMESDSTTRVRAVIFDESGDTSATVRATRLILLDRDSRFEARENVVVETPDDKILYSEHLVWFEADRTLRTPGFVRIVTPTERVQGYDLVGDEDLNSYTLRRMTGQVTVEEDE
ncbi:MAG: LPS export ABC transporter periplasmic protein LptC [Rhodothermales bacterium]